MPANVAKPAAPTKFPADPAFKFEVAAPKLFHFLLAATPDTLAVDAGVGEFNKKLVVPVPSVVTAAAVTGYTWTAPYVQWGYTKVVSLVNKKTVPAKDQ